LKSGKRVRPKAKAKGKARTRPSKDEKPGENEEAEEEEEEEPAPPPVKNPKGDESNTDLLARLKEKQKARSRMAGPDDSEDDELSSNKRARTSA